VPFREYSFLDNPRVSPADKNDSVRLRARGIKDSQADASLNNRERLLEVDIGANYQEASKAISARGWDKAYVVKVGARSLEMLCEDLGSADENKKFNTIIHRVLGIGEQVRFCDAAVNPRYTGSQNDPRNPINCTWGFHRPPPLPEGPWFGNDPHTVCKKDPAQILADRLAEPKRDWTGGGRERWSTRDRPGYLYRGYM